MKKKLNQFNFYLPIIFIMAVALMFFLMGLTYKHLQRQMDNNSQVYHSFDVSMEIQKLYADLKNIEIERRNYIVTKDSIYIKEVPEIIQSILLRLDNLKKEVRDNPSQTEELGKLSKLIERKLEIVKTTINQKNLSETNEELLHTLVEGNQVMENITTSINQMLETEQLLLDKRKDVFLFSQKNTPIYLYIVSIFSLMLLSFSFYKIMKSLYKQRIITQDLKLSLQTSTMAQQVGDFGIWCFDFENSIYDISKNGFNILGYEDKGFTLTTIQLFRLIYQEDLPKVKAEIKKILNNNTIKSFRCRLIRKDKSISYYQIAGKVVQLQEGKKILLGIISDVSEEEQMYQTLQEQNRILESTNEELQSFNYVASHDLQEPLRKIETFISRLNEKDYENLSEAGKNYLQRTTSSAHRMRKLIEDLLQFSRTTRKDQIFEYSDLNELMANAVDNLAIQIEEKNATVEIPTLPKMNVIPFQIQQLFINIIGNSLKYSKNNEFPNIKISVEKVKCKDGKINFNNEEQYYYKILFSDNGIGFKQEYADKIFMLFHRLHSRSEYEGTGIGLAICKKIMDNHNGYIFAKGQPDVGTTITIYIPVE